MHYMHVLSMLIDTERQYLKEHQDRTTCIHATLDNNGWVTAVALLANVPEIKGNKKLK